MVVKNAAVERVANLVQRETEAEYVKHVWDAAEAAWPKQTSPRH